LKARIILRTIVEACLQRNFSFKLAHGMILKLGAETLGSSWRADERFDNIPRTYGHLLRHGITYWNQDDPPPYLNFQIIAPTRVGPLLREL
jgi:hypothetical protein